MTYLRQQRRVRTTTTAAFTLVEVLVVIFIIALLAGLTLGGVKYAGKVKITKRVTAELEALKTAIDSYHQKLGHYPPDGKDNSPSPLFYELTGTRYAQNNREYQLFDGSGNIAEGTVSTVFGRSGFANSHPEDAQNFLALGKVGNQKVRVGGVEVTLLTVPSPGPNDLTDINGKSANLWRYTTGKKGTPTDPGATNNPDSFDLWAEVVIGGKVEIIGNWKTK